MLTDLKKDVRLQIMVNESQKDFLDAASDKEGISISALIRDMIDQYRLKQKDQRLKNAVNELYSEYKTNKELTAFTSIDGEDFYETRGSLANKP